MPPMIASERAGQIQTPLRSIRPVQAGCTMHAHRPRPYAVHQGRGAWNVSQLETCPDLSPVMNQRVRCSDEPWVKASGTT